MKKVGLLVVVVAVLLSATYAQMSFGVKGGLGLNNVRDFMVAPEGGFEGMT